MPKYRHNPSIPFHHLLVPTADTACYSFLLDSLLRCGRSVLLCGGAGVGKTAIVAQRLSELAARGALSHFKLHFSARTGSSAVQAAIETKLMKRGKNRWVDRSIQIVQADDAVQFATLKL